MAIHHKHDRKRIITALLENPTLGHKKLAKRIGVSRSVIYQVAQDHGIRQQTVSYGVARPNDPVFLERMKAERSKRYASIIELAKAGMRQKEIAAIVRCSFSTIAAAKRQSGLTRVTVCGDAARSSIGSPAN